MAKYFFSSSTSKTVALSFGTTGALNNLDSAYAIANLSFSKSCASLIP